MHLDFQVDIDSDPNTVFGWLARPEKAKLWMTSVSDTKMIDEKPGVLGTTFRERVQEGGDGLEMTGVVAAFEPNRRIGFHLESRVHGLDVDYRVEPAGAGCSLAVTTDIHWKFPVNVIGFFGGRAMKRRIVEQSSREFDRLKQLCEGRAADELGRQK